MNKLIQLVGLPASGKSTKAKEISEQENAIILSSDAMRLEIYGDEKHQDNNGELFNELYRRAREFLKNGQNVIIDATNINSKRRISTINEFKKYHKIAYYFNTEFIDCIERDYNRQRSVGRNVIDRMYKTLQLPTYTEGWDEIHIVSEWEHGLLSEYKKYIEDLITCDSIDHESLFDNLIRCIYHFKSIKNLPQDSKYHSLSVSRHTYYVWKYVLENYQKEDKLIMLWAALLHDIGKAHCKQFKDGSRYANFIGHENVSGQLAYQILYMLGYDDNFSLKVVELVQLHMRLLNIGESECGANKLRNYVGYEVFDKLKFFREADEQAK